MIYNRKRFNQKADFGNMLFAGTDIDFLTDIQDRFYLGVEWKTVGTGLPAGQALCFKRLVRDLGKVKPTFFLVAAHDTKPSEDLHGDNSFIQQVFYRLPNMIGGDDYIYEPSDFPSLNQWLGDFSYEWRIQKVLKARSVPLWEGIPKVDLDTWDRVTQPKGPSAFFDLIQPVLDAYRQC